MFDIGFWELMLIALVALIVVGPERLPKLIRVTGLWIGRANASVQSIRNEISRELRAEELKQALNKTVDVSNVNKIMDVEPKPKSEPELAPEQELATDSQPVTESKLEPEPELGPEQELATDPQPEAKSKLESEPQIPVKKDENGNG